MLPRTLPVLRFLFGCASLIGSATLIGCASHPRQASYAGAGEPPSVAEPTSPAGYGASGGYSADEAESSPYALQAQPAPDAAMRATSGPAGRWSPHSKTAFASGSAYPAPYPAPNPAPNQAQASGPEQAPADAGPAAKRLVHYSGSATLRSSEPERILDSAIAHVQAAGGYLEQRSPGFASLRVPSPAFDSTFQALLRLAEVLDFNQQAEDITEAAQDNDQRLKIVTATLERLEDLIRKARTEAQKLKLLKDLQRFREEREVLEARRRDLVQRARYASIRLAVRAYDPLAAAAGLGRDPADFAWIRALNPFDERRFGRRWRVKFPTPAGMVLTRKWFPWRASGSEGSEFWGSQVDVDLRGDSRFWRQAVLSRLGPGFKSADTVQAGAFLFCRFQSFGPSPYFYWVGVRSRGDDVDLAEFYFPTAKQQDALLPAMLAAVERKSR